MTPAEYGAYPASLEPPISDEVAEAAASILATIPPATGESGDPPARCTTSDAGPRPPCVVTRQTL